MADAKNGLVWKTMLGAAALGLTITLTLLASGGSWARQKEKVLNLEEVSREQQVKIDCHEKEIGILNARLAYIQEQLAKQDGKLERILERLPASRNP